MRSRVVATRYAQALFGVVDAQGREAVAEELLAVSQALQDPEIAGVLGNPRTPTAFKERLIATMHPSPHVEAFLRIMLENRRLDVLADAAAAFRDLVYQAQGKTRAEVTSAVPLSEEVQAALERKLAKLTGKDVEVAVNVDERLWAGLIIRVDGKVIDGSLAHSLQRAKEQLLR
ncbi:MAG TPA: ATP synthase F1 subunit delta [Firmicutes bacterium]|jgi:F-type H+-transporting ATPase subunit delta|nr:MAG: hypothetical protein AA931_02430 [Peptococcaceae bacterium 1109]HHT72631.1 ATP synthase F1 subunit delta [Bacillota bacterium]